MRGEGVAVNSRRSPSHAAGLAPLPLALSHESALSVDMANVLLRQKESPGDPLLVGALAGWRNLHRGKSWNITESSADRARWLCLPRSRDTCGVQPRPDVYLILVIPDARPESRWAQEIPRIGGRIEDARGRDWRVAEVLRSGRETYTVVCEPLPAGLAAVPELASDLLDRARRAVALTARRRRP